VILRKALPSLLPIVPKEIFQALRHATIEAELAAKSDRASIPAGRVRHTASPGLGR
jgi:hypothetical protein